jgi:phosphopantothenoylcysteine decarboxylase/phosphopantothenate--cysteine ligase
MTIVEVESAEEMYEAVTSRSDAQDIIIKAAAVADYKPVQVAQDKIKKGEGDMSIPLTRTQDILAYLGTHRREGQFLCGFSMETRDLLENSRKKLEKKHIDMVAANNVKVAGAGFGVDTNVLTLITREEEVELPLVSKDQAADLLLDQIVRNMDKATH